MAIPHMIACSIGFAAITYVGLPPDTPEGIASSIMNGALFVGALLGLLLWAIHKKL